MGYPMEFKEVAHSLSDVFIMSFPLPPDLKLVYGKDYLFVESKYAGTATTEEVANAVASGDLKEMYRNIHWDKHHLVIFGGSMWVNDLLPFETDQIIIEDIQYD